jgi:putative membrane protein
VILLRSASRTRDLWHPGLEIGDLKPCANVALMAEPAERDPRVYFAVERTFLAWIRTGLGLMGVGFAVARFGFFLRELHVGATTNSTPTNRLSVWSGVAIVVLGVLVNIGAVTEHFRITAQLRDGNWEPGRVSRNAVILALLLAVVGIAIAGYLVVSWHN